MSMRIYRATILRMSRVFLTGSEGAIGSVFRKAFQKEGIDCVPFDLTLGQDLLDADLVEREMGGCDCVVHLAVLASERTSDDCLGKNLRCLFNVLGAAEGQRVKTLVFMSSVDALGVFKGERAPAYFPIDDEHPCLPGTEYGIGKLLGERMCEAWSLRTGIPSIALRPPGVWFEGTYAEIERMRVERPSYEWDPFWEYGAFIDARDLFEATLRALRVPPRRAFSRYLVSAPDITTSGRTSLELARALHPDVPWKSRKGYARQPYKSLLDCTRARRELGWEPAYSWARWKASI
jgi:UDP-glucose 4-epimerase